MHRCFVVALGFTAALLAGGAVAQTYPGKPVKLIVTYPPGGSSDLMARVFGVRAIPPIQGTAGAAAHYWFGRRAQRARLRFLSIRRPICANS